MDVRKTRHLKDMQLQETQRGYEAQTGQYGMPGHRPEVENANYI